MTNKIFILLLVFLGGVGLTASYAQKPLEKPSLEKKDSEVRTQKRSGEFSGAVAGHDFVDLGLSVKWATCNLGAESPEQSGDYLAWGEIESKTNYNREDAKATEFVKDISGNVQYDAARSRRGDAWRMPTLKEVKELVSNCTVKWTVSKGCAGYWVCSKKNGKSLFFPAVGFMEGRELKSDKNYGGYWAATPYRNNNDAYGIFFDEVDFYWGWDSRGCGHNIRPVIE